MYKVLVEYSSGVQEIVNVDTSQSFTTSATVLWDESVSGTMPSPTPFILGGMTLSGGTLVYSDSKYLPLAKTNNINAFKAAINAFLDSRYSQTVRINFIGIYTDAGRGIIPKTNRQNYVAALFPFQNTVINYATTYIASINAMTVATDVDSTTWDFSSLISADPMITPAGALAISN